MMDQGFDKICLPKQRFVLLRFFSIYFTRNYWVKKIVHYTKNFVPWRFVLLGFHCIWSKQYDADNLIKGIQIHVPVIIAIQYA